MERSEHPEALARSSMALASDDAAQLTSRYPIDALSEAIERGQAHVQVRGASGGFRACVMADLSRRLERPLVIVTADANDAQTLAADLALFALDSEANDEPTSLLDEVALFPEFDVGPFHGASLDRRLSMQRLTTLYKLTRSRRPRFTVSSVGAALRKSMSPEAMAGYARSYAVNDVVTNDELRAHLTALGFSEVPVVEDPGTFALRGDIVDIFSPLEASPFRLERWGDDVAEVRLFDPQTQRSLEIRSECTIFPVRQEVLDNEALLFATTRLRQLAQELTVASKKLREVLADLQAGMHFIGIEALSPALHREMADLFDYIPEDALVVLVDPQGVVEAAAALWQTREEERLGALDAGEFVFALEDYYRGPEQMVRFVTERSQRLEWRGVTTTLSEGELGFAPAPEEASFEFRARQNTDVIMLRKQHQGIEQTLRAIAERLPQWKEQYGRICFACRGSGQLERLASLLESLGEEAMALPTPVDVSEPVPPPAGVIELYHADLSSGFRCEPLSLCVISGAELFGDRVVTHTKKTIVEHAAISHFRDLDAGDAVVHVDFGIGRYRGLVHLSVEGVGNDFLHLEYADGDKLYVPVYRLGRVQKYVGQTEGLRLDKLGGTRWDKVKERVKENIRAVAGDLLALYAKREMSRGTAFSPPDDFYREFEAAFPFEETPDQGDAIEDVIDDMVRPRPMDRLVCGDVGFGKTEVGIRAAMKAVMDGKQVAVLVPTTLLCEQHYISFQKRMKDFGARVEALNRFRSTKEVKQIIDDAADGKVDVLIGTHRLLSKDVVFRDLGLLVIDEEQRFGVIHKERIKQMRTNVDVLTLTATPIPRTLQMSMLGIRDLSIIATPPHARLSVRTHVAKFSDGIVREATMRELARGGQVFFVHNRVQTIEEMATHLRGLLPEARIAVAHGQMVENKLEEVMLSYVRNEVNVLVCSSIIESGLDIPNANTIIVNHAELFGLSQLYQLRGRVGRGKERAFAYLLVPAKGKLPADAEKRLEVIQTHTELGSGFQVASYDLEIRGAGNMLSDDQSGHVAAVGLDLYSELLEEAVNDIRGQSFDEDIEPEVNIAVEAYIPDDYVPATSLRLMFYKRFSLARSQDELFDIYGEMSDRFGTPPDEVRNLRDVIAIKVNLRLLRARRLDAGINAISIELDASTTLDPARVVDLVHETRGRWRLTSDMKLIFTLKPDESARPLQTSREVLNALLGL
ncbi:MAG: transcription-repair coupling factor [Bradymonadaceae bacterium]|nr:transcription-repair coupling factor [Lujinxingiaceae bacterium]